MANTAKPTGLQSNMDKATASFEALLTPPEETPEEVPGQAKQEVVAADETVEEETEELKLQEDVEETDEEESLEEDQVELEEPEQPPLYAVKVHGEEIEVTLDDLTAGYSRQKDYTRKTQEIAQEKQTLAQQRSELAEKDKVYSELLPRLQQNLQNELGNEPDWATEYAEDPIGYVRKRDLWNEKKEQLNAVSAEQDRLKEESSQKYNEQVANYMKYGESELLKTIPEWKDTNLATSERTAIRDHAINDLGFTAQEVDKVYDYRFVKVLRNSLLHSKTMKASKKNPKQKAAARVGRPGTVTQRKTTTSLKKAKTRLRKSGKVKDAAKIFEQIL